ncbi:uncharacterized protein LY89DRAFT_739493 [Mollisia scopiformis]|uniref:Uncharacterized protein n=1 Tax=Mollisia scopiformis TaxID=149040 RepID=A0A194WUK8_MOLSC|nr:uncharacterized protein LY89DRAFT_739493 [Mollisia scopiformis]KUJ11297.1 hypothetical protein LY89DRAFT_739493 [Mollisia scopiformis]
MEKDTENTTIQYQPQDGTRSNHTWFDNLAIIFTIKLIFAITFIYVFPYMNNIDESYGTAVVIGYGTAFLGVSFWATSKFLDQPVQAHGRRVVHYGEGRIDWRNEKVFLSEDDETEDDDCELESEEDSVVSEGSTISEDEVVDLQCL